MNGSRVRAALVAAATAIGVVGVAPPAAADDLTVTSSADSGAGTLRDAIAAANSIPGRDTITFEVDSVVLASPLPPATEGVVIDGTTMGGVLVDASAVTGDFVLSVRAVDSAVLSVFFAGPEGACVTCHVLDVAAPEVGGDEAVHVVGGGVGLGPDGTETAPSGWSGIGIAVNAGGADRTLVQGTAVVGMGGIGIEVGPAPETTLSVVAAKRNGTGIVLGAGAQSAVVESSTVIGNSTDGIVARGNDARLADDVVSGNGASGIRIVGGYAHVVDTAVGLDPSGDIAQPNADGIVAEGISAWIERSVVSGNHGVGIVLSGDWPLVQSTFVGTNRSGYAQVGNGLEGIVVTGRGAEILGERFEPSVVSGNGSHGIDLRGADQAVVDRTHVGTDVEGYRPIRNTGDGIVVDGSDDVVIGPRPFTESSVSAADAEPSEPANVVAANGGAGIRVEGSTGVLVERNLIGIDVHHGPLGNGGDGVMVEGSEVTVTRNGIDANGGTGIDLGADGPDDPGAPELDADRWRLDAVPDTQYTIELFTSPACDPSGQGEGRTYLGMAVAVTDSNGHAEGPLALEGDEEVVTATATGPDGTSEFSACDTVTPPPPPPPSTEVRGTVEERPVAVARSIEDACPPGLVPARRFPDVAADDPHLAAIDCLAWWQVTIGRELPGGGTGYDPLVPVTRGQLASFLARTIRRTGGTLAVGPNRFADDDRSPHRVAIDALAAAGIVEGRPDGSFGPDAPVSRDQMAAFVARAYAHRAGTALPPGPDFFDDDATNPHRGAIDALALAGVVQGTSERAFSPADALSRRQMASFLVRLLDLLVEQGRGTPPGVG